MSRDIGKNKLKIVVVGFLILFIPLIFLCKELENLYVSTKEDLKLELNEKKLSVCNKFKTDLETYNYLNSEISKVHADLFPNFKDEITDKIIDDTFAKNLYSKETFDKLILLTKDNFTPIFITFGTNNLENYITYCSPELDNQFENQKDKRDFIYSKVNYDFIYLMEHYKLIFKSNKYDFRQKETETNGNIIFKYLTRFKYYTKIYYTDYFDKQLIFNLTKYLFSKKGIHGYYSLIIPQNKINPYSIIDSAIKNNSSENVKIKLIPQNEIDLMSKTDNEFDSIIDFTTEFKNQIKIYKGLSDKEKLNLLNKAFKLSISYPEELEELHIISLSAKVLTIILALLYFFLFIAIYTNKLKIPINLTRKLILVLSIVIILPIIGVGLLTYIATQKISKIIDYNVSQNLSNEIDNLFIINEENNQRQLSEIFELKRKIENNYFFKEIKGIDDRILSTKEKDTWYLTWTNHLLALTQDGSFYNFYPYGKKNTKDRIEKTYGIFLPKYAENLNILNRSQKDFKNGISSSLTLGTLENYINLSLEEKSAGQESIPHRNLLAFNETYSAVYFYVKDYKKQHNLLINVLSNTWFRYKYINYLKIPKRITWFEIKNNYSDVNIGIAISNHFYIEGNKTYPFDRDAYRKVNDIIAKSILAKDSVSEKTRMSNGNIVKKCIYTDNEAFVIGGVAKSNYNTKLTFGINMIFPLLLAYASFLLFLLTDFISVFIKEPVKIYKEAIDSLENKEYGTTIDSFSKDEFDSITTAFNEMSLAIKQKIMISRYVSDRLIQSVNQNNVQEAGDGKQEIVTILSSDIRNFTGTSEKYEPSVIVEMLNSYFTKMQQAISENGGIIDKYIGDAIQAVFYDEPDKENQVIRAAKVALAMRKALEEFNEERKSKGLFTIENGIGIDTDIAVTGTIGTEKGRKDFSVNGDVVARAAELEAKTKQTISKILISKKSLDWIATASSKPRNDELYSKMVRCNNTNHTPHQSQLIFKEFDSESVELIDVR